MSTAAAIILFAAVTMYAIFGGADFGAGFWDLGGGRRGPWKAAAGSHRPLDRPSVGSQSCVVDLRLRRLVDVLPRGVRVDHLDDVRTPHPRGAWHCATRCQLCFSQSSVPKPSPAPLRSHLRRLFSPGALLFRCYRRRDRLRAGAGWRSSRRSGEQLDQPNLDRCRLAGRSCDGVRGRGLSHLGRRAALRRHHGGVLPHPRTGRGRCRRSRCHRRTVRDAHRCQLSLRRTHLARSFHWS
jgi:hypothetical protein